MGKKFFILISIWLLLVVLAIGGLVISNKTTITSSDTNTNNTSGSKGTSGVYGKILAGPTCPIVILGQEDKCQSKPVEAMIIVSTSNSTSEITRARSDKDGNFRIALEPGTYLLKPAPTNSYLGSKPQIVTVQEAKFTQVNLSYDTAIR